MSTPQKTIVHTTLAIIVLTCIQKSFTKNLCPVGFSLAYTKHRLDEPMCYRLKGPESFADKFEDCAGNLYTPKLYFSLNITTDNDVILWADYKNLYPGGPFVDWSYTETTGKILETSNNVKTEDDIANDEACVVIDPITNFTARKCDESHYRYCFVKPYSGKDDMEEDGCKDLDGYLRFWSPVPTCLSGVKKVEWGTFKANWRQARDVCLRRGGSLLTKGWRYANNDIFAVSNVGGEPVYPLGLMWNTNNTSLRYDAALAPNEDGEIPINDWHFAYKNITNEGRTYGALRNNFWDLVNSSYIFYDLICERPIALKYAKLNVTVDPESKLILSSNVTLDDDDIACYTDSKTYYPTKIKVRYDPNTKVFVLTPKTDGYYWCVLYNSRDYHVTESTQALFIREKQSLINHYAIKIHLNNDQKYKDLDDYAEYWQKKLEEYIFFRTHYIKVYGDIDSRDRGAAENTLKEFQHRNPALRFKEKELIYKVRIKRYMKTNIALLHVQLNPEMVPVTPGFWDDIEVEYMKPVYYCKGFDSVPMLPLGASITSSGCRTYTCVGNFVEGVQWVTTATSGCVVTSPSTFTTQVRFNGAIIDDNMPTAGVTLFPIDTDYPTTISTRNETGIPGTNDSAEITTTDNSLEMTTFTWTETVTTVEPDRRPTTTARTTTTTTTEEPTTTRRPPTPPHLLPEEQLLQVIDDLENLLSNDSAEIMVDDISETFDQVDDILNADDNLEIPGNLLHLLDQLGSRIDLNGSAVASTIRSNIALLLADAQPEAPVRGIRIAARDDDLFTDEAFEIISEVNSTYLAANESEAVVHLPESVSNSSRRISFVIFRTDRAFQNNHGHFAVNSRILSINVENITHFDGDEVIDIHLSPINEQPDRNASRACAYWHFFEDGTGYWSQEGCTFIRSTEEGVLDTCRCDHLTHFAEVLVPRAIFSQRNENALEILTIIGCFMSIIGLCLVGLTAILFRSWRREYSNKIWLQLCIAIFLMIVCFTVIVFLKFDYYNIPCMLIGIALHYSLLASFCWMLVAAVLSYRRLVIVFTRDASHKLLRASAFSWGAPCAVVGILLSVNPHSYAGQFEEKTPSGAFCYPSGLGLWLAVYAPIAAMLVANWTLFALIVRSVFASRRIQRHGDTNEAVRCASVSCLLVFLFGLPWIFGLFAYNVVAAYLFTLTATYQGFVLFVFFVLGNKKTRDLWLNKLKIKQTRKIPVTSSTYTHRSTGAGYRGDAEGGSTNDPNSTKPRSLAGSDNSRFS